MRYNEKESIKEIEEYIGSTYGQHYVGRHGVQTLDLLHSIGISEEVCQGNVIRYMSRLGKKNGFDRLDLLKAAHYVILMMHFSEDNKKNDGDQIQ
jgi:hypothetical protein